MEQASYEINENGTYQDFLTPNYNDTHETDLRNDINKFIHFARRENYQHPFQDANGSTASYSTNRAFGTGIGNEEFYYWQNNEVYTTHSSGIWSYGYWNTTIAYGYGKPINLGIE